MDQPPLQLEHPIHSLPIHADPLLTPQQGPQVPIPKRRMLLNQAAERLDPGRVRCHPPSADRRRAMQACAAHSQPPTTPPFRDTPPAWPSRVGCLPVYRVRFQGRP
jgi:hypothetical protein